ncbi:MAG: S49 family peptidase [Betaproteobacteria bacterium]|nr:S49 family peptidase [Betaproteobacteria bacterium]
MQEPSPPPEAPADQARPVTSSAEPVRKVAGLASDANWERATLEKLAFATLHEQRLARRWRNGLRMAWLMFLMVMAWTLFSRDVSPAATSSAHTAMVEISGEIVSDSPASAEAVNASLKAAFEDQGALAVVLLINSPGGSPVQAGIINQEIQRLKAKHGKPVYAVVEEACASAAYYVAVAADQIFVDKASIVGGIGVLMDGFGFSGLMNRLGIERRLLTAGENKGWLDPFSPMNDRQRAFAQTMLDQIHQQFIEAVKAGRGDRLKANNETFSGLFWSGQQAVEQGLADQLGSLEFVAREIVKAEEIMDYTRRDNVAERLAKRFGASVGEVMLRSLQAGPVLR